MNSSIDLLVTQDHLHRKHRRACVQEQCGARMAQLVGCDLRLSVTILQAYARRGSVTPPLI
jgi:hypothetical protein